MKILLILCFLLSSCASLTYYPRGDNGRVTPYFSGTVGTPTCYKCGEKAWLFKVDSKDRIICDKCYRELWEK